MTALEALKHCYNYRTAFTELNPTSSDIASRCIRLSDCNRSAVLKPQERNLLTDIPDYSFCSLVSRPDRVATLVREDQRLFLFVATMPSNTDIIAKKDGMK